MARSWSLQRCGPHATLAIVLLACACARPIGELHFHGTGGSAKSVFVIKSGWHSAIVIKKTDISERAIPEVKDFPDADYLEIGWGDWDYYQAADPGVGLALGAAFWSSGSVLHVTGLTGTVENFFPANEIVEVVLGEERFQRLAEFISVTFSRPDPAAPAPARPGLDPRSRFYRAEGRFHLFRTCNTWVAEALGSAGLPISSSIVTAEGLMRAVEPFGVIKKWP